MTRKPWTAKPTVAVDLDGVLAQYEKWAGVHRIGDPIPGAQEFMRQLSNIASPLIFTTRTTPSVNREEKLTQDQLIDLVRAWLKRHGFNGLYSGVWAGPGKPLAVAYVDDRAVNCNPQLTLTYKGRPVGPCPSYAFDESITKIRGLIEQSPWGTEQVDAALQVEEDGG